jgi:gluconolactonase
MIAALLPVALMVIDSMAADPAPAAAETLSLADGKLALTAPSAWVKKEPKHRGIVLFEFAMPKAEGDPEDGRVTIGPAGGGLEANQSRWLAQFSQPDGSSSKDRAKKKEKEVAGTKVHILDLSGTYNAPPFAGGGQFPDYRLLAAIIVTPQDGSWYVKLSGPEKTIAAQAGAFEKMIDSLQAK